MADEQTTSTESMLKYLKWVMEHMAYAQWILEKILEILKVILTPEQLAEFTASIEAKRGQNNLKTIDIDFDNLA